jgi:hypothetical protein
LEGPFITSKSDPPQGTNGGRQHRELPQNLRLHGVTFCDANMRWPLEATDHSKTIIQLHIVPETLGEIGGDGRRVRPLPNPTA